MNAIFVSAIAAALAAAGVASPRLFRRIPAPVLALLVMVACGAALAAR